LLFKYLCKYFEIIDVSADFAQSSGIIKNRQEMFLSSSHWRAQAEHLFLNAIT
jgi:hypothetical protein